MLYLPIKFNKYLKITTTGIIRGLDVIVSRNSLPITVSVKNLEKVKIINISENPIPFETRAEKRILAFFLGIFVNLDTNRISLEMALNLCTLLILTILRFQM